LLAEAISAATTFLEEPTVPNLRSAYQECEDASYNADLSGSEWGIVKDLARFFGELIDKMQAEASHQTEARQLAEGA
jgi:hypothetical protein